MTASRQRALRSVLLVGCGIGLNALRVAGPGEVTLVLGAFAYMPLALVLSPTWAVVAAGIALLPTLAAGGQPFLLVVGMLEVGWLALGRRWTRRHAALIDLVFWAALGLPLLLALEWEVARLPHLFAVMVALKAAVNLWAAVITADFLVRCTPVGRWLGAPGSRAEDLRELVFNYAFAVALVPVLLVGAGMTVMLRRLSEDADRQVLTAAAQNVSEQIEFFLRGEEAAVATAARIASRTTVTPAFLLDNLRGQSPEFIAALATDRQGRVVAGSPARRFAATPAPSVADRAYFQDAMRLGRPVISPVFRGRFGGGVLMAVSAPWQGADGKPRGILEAALDVRKFGQTVVQESDVKGLNFVIADAAGRVIYADPATGLRPLARVRFDPVWPLLASKRLDRRFVFARRDAVGTRRYYVARAVRSPTGIVVVAERPIEAALASISWIYALFAAVLAGIFGAAILVARAATRWLSAPLEHFARNAAAQAARNAVEPIEPPGGGMPREFALVFSSFNWLASKVRESHDALRRQNAELDRRVAERTLELESARQAAEDANRSKSSFIAMTSHEIRTPLNAIIGMADAAAGESEQRMAARLRTIGDAGRTLLAVTNDLLDLSRIEAGKLEIVPATVNLDRLCDELRELFALRAAEQGDDFRVVLEAPAPLWVRTDPGRLRQVLVNLVGNALKFTRQGEVCLAISAVPVDPALAVTFSVRDTGPGISPAEQGRLFEPYVQLANGRQQGAGGTGLGLAISRKIVALLGGELELRSQVGAGSTFHFTLRLERAQAEARQPVAAPAPAAARALRVLVADDNFANQEVVRAMLEPLAGAVVVVGSAGEAIAALGRDRFDTALIDLEMPDADGFTVARAAQGGNGASEARRCRLVAFSAFPRDQIWRECEDAGFVDFLAKPIVRGELLRLLEAAAPSTPPAA